MEQACGQRGKLLGRPSPTQPLLLPQGPSGQGRRCAMLSSEQAQIHATQHAGDRRRSKAWSVRVWSMLRNRLQTQTSKRARRHGATRWAHAPTHPPTHPPTQVVPAKRQIDHHAAGRVGVAARRQLLGRAPQDAGALREAVAAVVVKPAQRAKHGRAAAWSGPRQSPGEAVATQAQGTAPPMEPPPLSLLTKNARTPGAAGRRRLRSGFPCGRCHGPPARRKCAGARGPPGAALELLAAPKKPSLHASRPPVQRALFFSLPTG